MGEKSKTFGRGTLVVLAALALAAISVFASQNNIERATASGKEGDTSDDALGRLIGRISQLDRQAEAWVGRTGNGVEPAAPGSGGSPDDEGTLQSNLFKQRETEVRQSLWNATYEWKFSKGEFERLDLFIKRSLSQVPKAKKLPTYYNWSYYPKKLKVPMPFPSNSKPLLLFHVPKCAGSTLEKHFFQVALSIGVSFVKPCPYTGRPTVFSSLGYGHYPQGFKPLSDPLDCGKAESQGCSESSTLTIQSFNEDQVLRVSLACASMILGHFTPNLLNNLKATQHWIRQNGNKWAADGGQGAMTAQQSALSCAQAGDEAFCRKDTAIFLEPDTGRMSAPGFSCITSVREPIARSLSHYYHFGWLKEKGTDSRRCEEFSCLPYHQLELEQQQKVFQLVGGNTQLMWLTAHIMADRTHWIGRPISEWVSAGMALLTHCALAVVERWAETREMFAKIMPWAAKMDLKAKLTPHAVNNAAHHATSIASRDSPAGGGAANSTRTWSFEDEFPLLRGSMPHTCLWLAPDVFFYKEAVTLFRRRLLELNLAQEKVEPEHHFCDRVYKKAGISRHSLVTNAMVQTQ